MKTYRSSGNLIKATLTDKARHCADVEVIAHIQDYIYKGLYADLRVHWLKRLMDAPPVVADLRSVLPVFLLSLLNGLPPQEGEVKVAIEGVKKILITWRNTGQVDKEAAKAAEIAVTEVVIDGARVVGTVGAITAGGMGAVWAAIWAASVATSRATRAGEKTWTIDEAEFAVAEAVEAAKAAVEAKAGAAAQTIQTAWTEEVGALGAARKVWVAEAVTKAARTARAVAWKDISYNFISLLELKLRKPNP